MTTRLIQQKKSDLAVRLMRSIYRNVSGKELSIQYRREKRSTSSNNSSSVSNSAMTCVDKEIVSTIDEVSVISSSDSSYSYCDSVTVVDNCNTHRNRNSNRNSGQDVENYLCPRLTENSLAELNDGNCEETNSELSVDQQVGNTDSDTVSQTSDINRSIAVVNNFEDSNNSYSTSKSGVNGKKDQSLVFGEIVPLSFMQILGMIDYRNKNNLVFVDLGSGIGRACLCAALSPFPFKKVWGIEIVPSLVDVSHDCLQKLRNYVNTVSPITTITDTNNSTKDESECVATQPDKLYQLVVKQLQTVPDKIMKVDYLVNMIIKEVGHKRYKVLMKPFKSFIGFANSYAADFALSTDKKDIQFLETNCASIVSSEDGGEAIADSSSHVRVGVSSNTNRQEVESDKSMGRDNFNSSVSSNHNDRYTATELALLQPLPEILFDCGNIFDINWWEEADVVYVASLLFTDAMMIALTHCVYRMKVDSYFISLKPLHILNSNSKIATRSATVSNNETDNYDDLESRTITLISESFFKMSWQMAKVYLYKVH